MKELWWNSLLVGFGGFFGAIFRHGLTLYFTGPTAILTANLLGCFFAGILTKTISNEYIYAFLIIGCLGAFTTFSAFATITYESKSLLFWASQGLGCMVSFSVGRFLIQYFIVQ